MKLWVRFGAMVKGLFLAELIGAVARYYGIDCHFAKGGRNWEGVFVVMAEALDVAHGKSGEV